MNPYIIVNLSIEQQRNLLAFLNRVEVKGINEASALIDLARTIGSAKPIEEVKVEQKELSK